MAARLGVVVPPDHAMLAPTRFLVTFKVAHLVNDYMVEAPKTPPRALKCVEMAGLVPDGHFDDRTAKITPGSYLAWHESDGSHTRMEKLGDGGVLFCSYYAEMWQECEIWLLGSVQSSGRYPLVLRSSRGDGLTPFTLDWNSGSGTNLGYLNKGFVENASSLGHVPVRWRPVVSQQDFEHTFTIPFMIVAR